ncbi:MAG: hypothetical protein ACRC80_06125 [Waterburya sp.]
MTQESILNSHITELLNEISTNIDESELQAITLKLQGQRILGVNETLEQWLLEMMPQITDGSKLTVPELLAGLKQFLELK